MPTVIRRTFFKVFTMMVLCFVILCSQNVMAQKSVSIVVSQDNWGEARTVDIQKVLESAANELWVYFPNKRLETIKVVYDADTPRTRCAKGSNGEYIVQLTAQNRRWAQFSYQFAHEFFHVLSNYDKTGCNSGIGTENQWFEESLAEVSSMFVLRQMAATWKENPPYSNWKSYASSLEKYGEDLRNDTNRQLPPNTKFIKWFKENHSSLRNDPYLRAKNKLIANRLLPFFERSPESWEAIGYFNLGTPDSSNSFQAYLNNWHKKVPVKYESFVENIAKEFGMRITN
ncbi:MAG TPA: hypothetical protein VK892_08955 [Pyrinomonadaceae bacterium]|nr:hypothetical protein [Pyrinomonadaceae bacterium]